MAKAKKSAGPSDKGQISLREAYTKVREWYQAHVHLLKDQEDDDSKIAYWTISALPVPEEASEIEMRFVMQLIIEGILEWGYNNSDGEKTMGEYARQAIKPYGGPELSDEDEQELKKSNFAKEMASEHFNQILQKAENYAQKGDVNSAINGCKEAYELARSIDNINLMAKALFGQARILGLKGETDRALQFYKQASDFAKSADNMVLLREIWHSAGEDFQKKSNFDMAEAYYKDAVDFDRSRFREEPDKYANGLLQSLLYLEQLYDVSGKKELRDELKKEIADVSKHIKGPQLQQETQRISGSARITESSGEINHQEKPTPKIISDRWMKNDWLGYGSFARALAELITHPDTCPPLNIGIKAPWGAGKTSIMKMVQYMLDKCVEEEETGERKEASSERKRKISLGELLGMLKKDELEKPKPRPIEPGTKGHENAIKPHATVWFNAWKYQTSEQIWAGLAHAIISQVTKYMDPYDREIFWLKLNRKRVSFDQIRQKAYKIVFEKIIPRIAVIGGIFIVSAIFFGVFDLCNKYLLLGFPGATLLYSLADWLMTKKITFTEEVAGDFKDILKEPDYEGKMGFLHLVESDMKNVIDLVATEEQPLVVFIDDLDRCSPNKVAEIVEALNLFLCGDFPNCIFVIAMEPSMVAAAMEVAHKDVNAKIVELALMKRQAPLGWLFMEKIVQLPLLMPMPTSAGVQKYLDLLVSMIPQGKAKAEPAPEEKPPDKKMVEEMIKKFEGFENVQQVVKQTEDLLKKSNEDTRQAVVEASKRAYKKTFRDRDPAIRKLIEGVSMMLEENPRQLKRYINLFRFMSTLRHYLIYSNADFEKARWEMPDDNVLTKFVSLCIHWPQSVDCFYRVHSTKGENSEDISRPLIACMEEMSQAIKEYGLPAPKADAAWKKYLENSKLSCEDWAATSEFRTFLARSESIGKYAGCGLW